MINVLDEERRERIWNSLTKEQRDYITSRLKRGYRTAFANEMAKSKGAVIYPNATYEEIEKVVDDWILIDFIDHVERKGTCECGRSLRYEYIVRHVPSKRRLSFGRTHFEQHTQIDAKIVADILKEFRAIDLERDEILTKVDANWNGLDGIFSKTEPLADVMEQLPKDIQEHLQLDLPLLDRQMRTLRATLAEIRDKKERERLDEALTDEAKQVPFDALHKKEHRFEYEQLSFITNVDNGEQAENEGANKPFFHIDKSGRLPDEMRERIDQFIEDDVKSARIICEMLIKEGVASQERYVTGKPKIYYYVCLYLDELVTIGKLLYVEGDLSNRVYEKVM